MKSFCRIICPILLVFFICSCATKEGQKQTHAHLDKISQNQTYSIADLSKELDCNAQIILYSEAMTMVQNFRQHISTGEKFVHTDVDEQYARGQNIDLCLLHALDATKYLSATYAGMRGFAMMYGLKSAPQNESKAVLARQHNRLAILIPQDANGMALNLGPNKRVVYFSLLEDFTDPCPKHCDY